MKYDPLMDQSVAKTIDSDKEVEVVGKVYRAQIMTTFMGILRS